MSPIFGIGLFAYCIRDTKDAEEARRKKTDESTGVGGASDPPVFMPAGGAGAGAGAGVGSGMGAAVY